MSCVIRHISAKTFKQLDIYRGSPYEYDATAPVGQTIILVTSVPLAISGSVVRNPLSTPFIYPPSAEKKQLSKDYSQASA